MVNKNETCHVPYQITSWALNTNFFLHTCVFTILFRRDFPSCLLLCPGPHLSDSLKASSCYVDPISYVESGASSHARDGQCLFCCSSKLKLFYCPYSVQLVTELGYVQVTLSSSFHGAFSWFLAWQISAWVALGPTVMFGKWYFPWIAYAASHKVRHAGRDLRVS